MRSGQILKLDLEEISLSGVRRYLLESSTRERVLITFLLAIAVFGRAFYFSWLPKGKQLLSMSAQLEQEIQVLADQTTKLEASKQVIQDVQVMRSLLPLLKVSLPVEQELPALLREIHDTLLSSGLGLLSFEPRESKRNGVVSITPIHVVMEGSGPLIAYIPNLLLSLNRKVTLTEAKFTQAKEGGAWRIEGVLNAYWQMNTVAERRNDSPEVTPIVSPGRRSALLSAGEELTMGER